MRTLITSILTLAFSLSFLSLQAQVVNIPDSVFLARLIEEGVDTNGDGKIQLSEALIVTELNLSGQNQKDKIIDLQGLENFTNLEKLTLDQNEIKEINLSSLVKLLSLSLSNNKVENIDVSNNTDLVNLRFSNNLVENIDLSNLLKLRSFHAALNKLTSIDLSSNIDLERLTLHNNLLTELDLSNNSKVKTLLAASNKLIELDLSNLADLEHLNCGYNKIQNLIFSDHQKMRGISASGNLLTNIDVSGMPSLTSIGCAWNNLDSLDLSNNLHLTTLNCRSNKIEHLSIASDSIVSLNVGSNNLDSLVLGDKSRLRSIECDSNNIAKLVIGYMPSLKLLKAQVNKMTSLNLENAVNVEEIDISYNRLLYLNVSNNPHLGSSDYFSRDIYNNPYSKICTHPYNYQMFKECVDRYNISNCVISNYCFGEKYYKPILFDLDEDRFYNRGYKVRVINANSDIKYQAFENFVVRIRDADTLLSIEPLIDLDLWKINKNKVILDSINIQSIDSIVYDTFYVTRIIDSLDVSLTFIPDDVPRAGFESCYNLYFRNTGTVSSLDTVKLEYQSQFLKYINSSEDTIQGGNNELRWVYNDLKPFEEREIEVCFRLNSPMDNPPLNNGDTIKFKATICPIEGDMNPEDNVAVLCQEVRNSWDPNDKQCLEGATVTPDMLDGYVHYMIRFENLGTAEAVNIVVRDIIDTSTFDINSFYTVDASHSPFTTTIYDDRIVEFEFKDIYLPFDDENNDGYVVFAIKPKDHITIGDSLSNQADIYFDFNFPITTNDAITVVTDYPTFVPKYDNTLEVAAYPNPTSDFVTITSQESIQSISIYTLDGRMVRQEVFVNGAEKIRQVNMSGLLDGVYMVRILGNEDSGVVKVVKE